MSETQNTIRGFQNETVGKFHVITSRAAELDLTLGICKEPEIRLKFKSCSYGYLKNRSRSLSRY